MRSFVQALPGLWRTKRHAPAMPWLIVGFCALAVLASCGGGGGVGSGGTGATASGTVTGFGSIIVDGVRFDDSKAAVSIERSASDDAAGGVPAEAKFGHQVIFSFEGKNEGEGVAKSISIEPTLVGPVGAPPTATSLLVLGRTITINTDRLVGPVTVFEPNQAAITAGTQVEVHAILGGTTGTELVATRIEVTSSPTLRVSGVISGLSATTLPGVTTMTVAGGSVVVSTGTGGSTIVPAGTTLTNGQSVVVFADRGGFTNGTLTATRVRVNARGTSAVDDYVGGLIAGLNKTDRTFTLGGIAVSYRSASVVPSTSDLQDQQYVRVRGTLSSNGRQLEASKISLRSSEAEAELHGNILGFVAGTGAVPSTFTIRDVAVTVPAGIPLDFSRCTGVSALAEAMFVEVKASTTATGVTATSVKCDNAGEQAVGATVERSGTVSAPSVTNTARVGSFTLVTKAGDSIKVQYNELTFFRAKTVGGIFDGLSLNGVRDLPVEVEGQLSATGSAAVLTATKIKQDD